MQCDTHQRSYRIYTLIRASPPTLPPPFASHSAQASHHTWLLDPGSSICPPGLARKDLYGNTSPRLLDSSRIAASRGLESSRLDHEDLLSGVIDAGGLP